MKALPANLVLAKNKVATPDAWLVLLDITLNDIGATVLHLVRNTENITYGGHEYTAVGFDLEPGGQTSTGVIPSVTLKVSNITRLLQAYMRDLSGAVGCTVKITIVNSNLLAEDYAELEMTFDVIESESSQQWVTFKLGAPNPLRQRFPLFRYIGMHCRWRYRTTECAYVGKTIATITLPSGTPVSIGVTAHGFVTGDIIRLTTCTGITGGLEGDYTITKTSANAFTLNGTNGSSYGGSYTSGGIAGYATCNRTLGHCTTRANAVRFGGFPGIRSGTVRIA